MENYTVCQLQRDMRFEGVLLVRSADLKSDKNGKNYVDMNLVDRTGEMNAKIWNWESQQKVPENGSVLWIRGTVQEYNDRLQMRVEKWRATTTDDRVDMKLLVPAAPRNGDEMLAEVKATVEGFKNEELKLLSTEMLKAAGNRLLWFPAAQRMHHAERSGLLHHMTDMLKVAEGVINVYPWLNGDLLKTGIIIHDLGKIDEMKSDPSGNVTDYSMEGQLLGHIVKGITNLQRIAEQTGISGETIVLLEHMLLSHHGESEYGSPKPPMFPEAEMLRWIDMMDARMNTMKGIVDKTPAGAFSEKVASLERRVYHPKMEDPNTSKQWGNE